ncbi:aminoglycoside phosphotransferase family protein [Solicola gregarius]|uniref:Aminoglycoside phosphotransferase family protein n=1 Tax=Solicola gregarius TaxID=2908642 RepID=A0AA46TIB4_9ACTN|nr:aminoglycoside phosphotransferase family protein [Solicola gregarius]UYM05785.1 aminoglycoside phosphotransferase family protein [Solicola gregarius]
MSRGRGSFEVGDAYVLSFNWVAPVRRADGSLAVLKLGVPESEHLYEEAAALRCFAGDGAIRLLDRDLEHGALLLERAEPGTMLRELVPERDDDATDVVIDILRRLHVPPPDGVNLPDVSVHRASFRDHLRYLPCDVPPVPMVERALSLFDDLCASATERVVLHGDLHHDNVLRSEREPWLAIDPHGLVGDPGFEIAPLLYNPDPGRHDDELLALVPARLERLAAGLGVPMDRAVAWAYVGCVLSAVWDAEGGDSDGGRPLDVALMLESHVG